MPIRVLHIVEPLATGILNFLVDLTKKQAEEYEVYILWGARPLTPDNVEMLFDKRVQLIKIDAFKGAMKSVINPKSYIEVNIWCNKIKPDIVHMHSAVSGFVGRWAILCNKTKAIYTPHGYSFLSNNGGILRSSLAWIIEKLSALKNCLTVACSKGEYEEAKKLTKNCTFVNNGLDTKLLIPYVKDAKDLVKPIKICTSGRIYPQKNPKLFNAIARLLPDMEFIWIGDGTLKYELIAENIKVTGWVDREAGFRIMASSDFFILPSLWEGLPLALLEAMYLKKMCLVSNVIGNKNVIDTGRNGMICNSAEDYANNILIFVQDKDRRISMAEEAHRDVELFYSVDVMAKSYSKIYTSLLNNSQNISK